MNEGICGRMPRKHSSTPLRIVPRHFCKLSIIVIELRDDSKRVSSLIGCARLIARRNNYSSLRAQLLQSKISSGAVRLDSRVFKSPKITSDSPPVLPPPVGVQTSFNDFPIDSTGSLHGINNALLTGWIWAARREFRGGSWRRLWFDCVRGSVYVINCTFVHWGKEKFSQTASVVLQPP